MPSRGIMRAKQRKAGSLGQGNKFYYLAGKTFSKVAGAQGFGKTNPSIGSMKSLGVMKQNRNAGGNNICKETMTSKYYYTQQVQLSAITPPPGTLLYITGTRIPLGVVTTAGTGGVVFIRHANPQTLLTINTTLNVSIVPPGMGRPGFSGVLTAIGSPVKNVEAGMSDCNCRGPRGYCSNCSGRNNPHGAITGGSTYSGTTGFAFSTH